MNSAIPCKIERQKKAFIDKNLQIIVPGLEKNISEENTFSKTIYSHFEVSGAPIANFLTIEENELRKAMDDAKYAYESWKNLHQQILKNMQTFIFKNAKK